MWACTSIRIALVISPQNMGFVFVVLGIKSWGAHTVSILPLIYTLSHKIVIFNKKSLGL